MHTVINARSSHIAVPCCAACTFAYVQTCYAIHVFSISHVVVLVMYCKP